MEPAKRFVISDLRFLHEYEALLKVPNIREEDIVIIRVIRSQEGSQGSLLSQLQQVVKTHVSEIEYMQIPCDIILINDSTIQSYIEKFDKIMEI
jgi:hypothetical protein